MKITFRKANESDMSFLLELRNVTMNEHIENAGLSINQNNHPDRINYHFDSAQIIEYSNQPIGLLKVLKENPVWDLVQIQLLKEFQGRGLGRKILASVISEARENKCVVKLSVYKSNPALKLYISLGFTPYGETEHTYELRHSNK